MRFDGTVESVNFMGSVIRIKLAVGDEAIWFDMFDSPDLVPPAVGQRASAHAASRDLFELSA